MRRGKGFPQFWMNFLMCSKTSKMRKADRTDMVIQVKFVSAGITLKDLIMSIDVAAGYVPGAGLAPWIGTVQ